MHRRKRLSKSSIIFFYLILQNAMLMHANFKYGWKNFIRFRHSLKVALLQRTMIIRAYHFIHHCHWLRLFFDDSLRINVSFWVLSSFIFSFGLLYNNFIKGEQTKDNKLLPTMIMAWYHPNRYCLWYFDLDSLTTIACCRWQGFNKQYKYEKFVLERLKWKRL